ncbi:MAG: ABC transporter ATP-binding protein [Pusillimonas sp.]
MLSISELGVAYGPIKAVEQATLKVGHGEIVALIGANGAGKSSLLRGATGLVPTSGSVHFDGRDITRATAPERVAMGIAMAPEGRQVFTDQTVHENLLLGGFLIRKDKDRLHANIERSFELFPRLRERREQLAGTLSGGEQQMLAIARALMSDPRMLILDEPSLGLAPLIARDIFRTLVALRSQGMTILLVEQMALQALGIADRAYVLENGRIVLEGSGAELRHNPRICEAYLGGAYAGGNAGTKEHP